jgi:hypothetical protein
MHRPQPVRIAIRLAAIAISMVVLLCACGVRGDSFAGPDPGGGYPCPNNAFEDCARP